ncbi:hypothetical protein [Bradyrhizobium sp. USDA 10063]
MLVRLADEARKGIGASSAMSQRIEESAIVNAPGIMLLMRNCAERSRAPRILMGRRIR